MSANSYVLTPAAPQHWIKWTITTLVLAVIAFLANPSGPLGSFWRPSPEIMLPTGAQLLLFILLTVAEAIAFGLGISFLIFGFPVVRHVLPRSKGLAVAAYLSIAWLLANWWPHDSLHVANGMNMGGLLAIEYVFHVTLMAAGVILALFFFAVVRGQAAGTQ